MAQSWIGIRVSAALAILGSLLSLLFGVLLVWAVFNTSPSHGEALRLRPLLFGLAVFLAALAAWGLATGTAIFRRRRWARISALILAVLLVGMGVSALIAMLFVAIPVSPDVSRGMAILAAFYGGLMLVGAWWLLLFNSRGAKLYFTGPEEPSESGRPLSIAIIGVYLLLCAAGTAAAAIFRVPAALFGWVITGWGTLAVYTVCTAVEIWLGTGLLQFQNPARIGSIVFFALVAANSAVWAALPDFAQRMRELEAGLPRFLRPPPHMPALDSMSGFLLIGSLFALVPIWFLVRRRAAFR